MSLPAWLPAPLLALALAAAGHRVARRLPGTAAQRLLTSFLAGCLLLHLWLSLLDLVGQRWSLALVLAPLLIAAAWGWRPAAGATRSAAPGWGDLVAFLAVFAFAALASTLWITFPDFIYHWGLKGHRFLLAGHVDYRFLARPESWAIHPDYPNFFPELLATTALVGGGWNERALLLWSPLLLLATLLGVRELLVVERLSNFRRHAVVTALALATASFAIASLMAGAADWLTTLVLVTAVPALLAPPSTTGDVQLGLCAAFAAMSKQEGAVLAAVLVTTQLVRHLRRRLPVRVAGAAGLLALPSLVVAHSWARIAQHHLLQSYDKGLPSWERLPAVLDGIGKALVSPVWHGFALLLLALPALLTVPRLRPFVAVAGLELVAYGLTCTGQPSDAAAAFLVLTTFTRVVLLLLPATVAAAAVGWLGGEPARAG